MNCPDIAAQCPGKPGQTTGTGLARAYRESGTCPVPVPVPLYPGDVPLSGPQCQEVLQVTWTALDGEFFVAVLKQAKGWTNLQVVHRTRRPRTGSWRLAWSEQEGRLAKSSELGDMSRRFPYLLKLVEDFCRANPRKRGFRECAEIGGGA